MLTSPKISIIVPIYNQEAYLQKSLSSIRDNDFEDYEVLLIDDGSTDRSREICLEYGDADSRFKYFEKSNGGVASARQFGLEHASGDYIIHLDPDDWVEPTYLAELYAKAEETKADITVCDYIEEHSERSIIIDHAKYNNATIEELKLAIADNSFWGVCWNKLVRRRVITKYNLHFEEDINFQEDKLFTYRLLDKVKEGRVTFVVSALYHYNRRNLQSSISTFSYKHLMNAWQVKNLILSLEDDQTFKPKLKEHLITLSNVRQLIVSKEIPLSRCSEFMKPFKDTIQKLAIKSRGSMITRLIALMALYRIPSALIRSLKGMKIAYPVKFRQNNYE